MISHESPAGRGRIDVDYRVQVAYTAPVEVIVDLEKGKVDRVVVIDEAVALDTEEGAREETNLRPVPITVARSAIAIAEGDGRWPVWEHGF